MTALIGAGEPGRASLPADGLSVLLRSAFDLGHQPFGLASPAAWLAADGAQVACLDLAVQKLDDDAVRAADLIGFYLPMHTATRILAGAVPRVRELNPDAHLCAYGLYAPVNAGLLRRIGIASIIGGEFEQPLAALARDLRSRGNRPSSKSRARPCGGCPAALPAPSQPRAQATTSAYILTDPQPEADQLV